MGFSPLNGLLGPPWNILVKNPVVHCVKFLYSAVKSVNDVSKLLQTPYRAFAPGPYLTEGRPSPDPKMKISGAATRCLNHFLDSLVITTREARW